MGRIIESKENQYRMQKQIGIATEEKRQVLLIGMLADIADSLAFLCDLYAIANGIKVETKEMGEDGVIKP